MEWLGSIGKEFVHGFNIVFHRNKFSLGLGISPSNVNRHKIIRRRQSFVSKGLFNDKLIITLGSSVGLSGEQVQDGRNLAQDVQLEYRLDDDGTYRLKAYRKNQYEGIIDGLITKTGVGISIGKEFEDWADFFKKLQPKESQ